jgi:hypothetical protein
MCYEVTVGDNMVFLYFPQCVFTPQQPCRTLFSVRHVQYVVVLIRGPVFYFDRVDIFYNYVDMNPLFSKIACPYEGTYLLFSQEPISGMMAPVVPTSLLPLQQSSVPPNNQSG